MVKEVSKDFKIASSIFFIILLVNIISATSVTRTVPEDSLAGGSFNIIYTANDVSGNWRATISEKLSGGCTFADGTTKLNSAMNKNQGETKSVTVLTPSTDSICILNGNYKFGAKPITSFPEARVEINGGDAPKVAYIYKKIFNVDKNIVSTFNELGLSVELINEKNIPKDFSKYKLVFIGDERYSYFSRIPVGDVPTIISNYYYGEEWGITDQEGVSKLGSSDPLEVKKDSEVIQVYTQARFEQDTVSIPYYYLDDNDKVPSMRKIAATFTGDGEDVGDVISYADSGTRLDNGKLTKANICFYGIIESKYWTPEAKKLFKDCVDYVGSSCSHDKDCPHSSESEPYCYNGSLYKDIVNYKCINPHTSISKCVAETTKVLVQECYSGCENKHCIIKCTCDADCGTDSFIDGLFCQNNNVFQNFIKFTCNYPNTIQSYCSNSTNAILKANCGVNQVCNNGMCKNIACYKDSDCNDNDPYTYDKCINPGTSESSCTHMPIHCNNNNDCGADKFIDGLFCKDNDVYQKFISYTCNNPGTPESICSNNINPILKKDCNDLNENCIDGECKPIIARCYQNSDCGSDKFIDGLFCKDNDVYQNFLKFTCNNPGTRDSSCSNSTTEVLKTECQSNQVCNNGQCNNIACYKDLDCGTNGLSGDKFCKNNNVFDNFITYKCNNPGTSQSSCTNTRTETLIEQCSNQCSNGQCIECSNNNDCGTSGFIGDKFCKDNNVYKNFKEFTCINPGQSNSKCQSNVYPKLIEECPGTCFNGECKQVVCRTDNDCNDNNASTYDECNNPGTSSSYCSHTPVNCVNNNDCGPTGFIGNEQCVQDNVFKNFQNSTCRNPGTRNSYCDISITQIFLKDCGQDYCEAQGSNYCKDNKVIRSKRCYDKGCSNGICFSSAINMTEEIVQVCNANQICNNGECQNIICNQNTDCGTNHLIDGLYCQNNNVFQNFLNFVCNNPGTPQSSCSNYTSQVLKNNCTNLNQVCNNGQCQNIVCRQNSDCGTDHFIDGLFCKDNNVFQNFLKFTCNNPGTTESYCSNSTSSILKTNCNNNQVCNNGECQNIVCRNDSECNDNDIYTIDKCNNPGTPQSYCSHTPVNCVNNNDCGPTGFIGNEQCIQDNVFKNFQNSSCKNPGTINSYCDITVTQILLKNCGSDYCDNFGQNYCKGNSVFHSRTCYDKGCLNGVCFSNTNVSEEPVLACSNNQVCNNGECQNIVCRQNTDCGTNHLIDGLYCQNNNVYQNYLNFVCNNPGTPQSTCTNYTSQILKNNCTNLNQVCNNGECQNIVCRQNSDCGTDHFIDGLFCKDNDVYQNFLKFTCNNPGTIQSYCFNSTSQVLKEKCSNLCLNGECKPITPVCDKSRSTVGIPVILPNTGVKFTALSNTVTGPTNTLTVAAQNLDNSYKTLTYSKLSCRCNEHQGNPIGANGLGSCNFFWSGELISPSCKVVEESLSLAPYETKNIQVDVKQYQDKTCGSFQLDFILTKVNGITVSGTDGERLVGWSFTDLCQDCTVASKKCSGTVEFLAPYEIPAGLKFTGISNTLNGPVNTYSVQIQNLENINKVVTYSKGICRCNLHNGDAYDAIAGHSACDTFWSGESNPPSCQLVPETISLGPYESKIVEVQTAQYQNKVCGSTQLDMYVDSVNGVAVPGDLSRRIIGAVFTDLCQDCQPQIRCNSNSDCGVSQAIESQYCENNNIYQKYMTVNCVNPGTYQSQCYHSITSQLVQANGCAPTRTSSKGYLIY